MNEQRNTQMKHSQIAASIITDEIWSKFHAWTISGREGDEKLLIAMTWPTTQSDIWGNIHSRHGTVPCFSTETVLPSRWNKHTLSQFGNKRFVLTTNKISFCFHPMSRQEEHHQLCAVTYCTLDMGESLFK